MANLIAQPRKWKNKAVLIKLEATYGVDATPTGAANWIEARNVNLTPMDTEKVATNIILPYMGNSGSIVVGQWAKLSFDVALAPSGVVGTAPKWAPLIMACGMAETIAPGVSVNYNLVSNAFSSVVGYINIDGTLHKLCGMRGEVKGKVNAKGAPMLSFSFDALYLMPATDGMPVVTRTGWKLEEGVNSKNTAPVSIDGIALSYSAFDWSIGNKVARIDLPGPQYGIEISDRSPQASITVLAPDLAVFNPFAMADAGTTVPVSATHGSAAGKKIKTDLKARIVGVDYDQIDEMTAYKLTLEPLPVNGNDEIALSCL
ncbi:phage tail tube protein [Undibacterium sp. Ren11W]|uniref:phage tail tube protein n=1 Tax=Undibacterium sp. Ren11W TaxID=3413045 RepID=UPI003BEFAE46